MDWNRMNALDWKETCNIGSAIFVFFAREGNIKGEYLDTISAQKLNLRRWDRYVAIMEDYGSDANK